MQWVRGKLGQVVGLANATIAESLEAARGFELSERDFLRFRQAPSSETLSELVAQYLPNLLQTCLQPLLELAARGIQLEAERKARADLADRYEALKSEHTVAISNLELAESENAKLYLELARIEALNAERLQSSGKQHSVQGSDESLLIEANLPTQSPPEYAEPTSGSPDQRLTCPVPRKNPAGHQLS